MPVNKNAYTQLVSELKDSNVQLVAVTKVRSTLEIQSLYNLEHRHFAENYVQELVAKQTELPNDIKWHFIGHLQSNKVKFIAPYIHLIQSVDSYKLLKEINKQAKKLNRVIECLFQIHIASEDTKYGMDENELAEVIDQLKQQPLANIRVKGLMGMATFTEDTNKVRGEFKKLKILYDNCREIECGNISFSILSMGMSDDYALAIEEGSNMVRVGSLLFGKRP